MVFPSRKIVLPQKFHFLNFLESHGTEYIDSGLTANQNSRFESVFTITADQSVGAVFAAEEAYQDRMYGVDSYGLFYGNNVMQWSALTKNVEHKIEVVGKKFYLDESLAWDAPAAFSFVTPVNCTLFAFNTATNVVQFSKMRMKYLKYWQDGTNLSRDFRPALDGNGVPGMYDLVSSQYFYNAGTGTFGYG